MKAVNFEGANLILAKDQPEFYQLPVLHDPASGVCHYCHELTFEEIQEVIKTKRIWSLQVTQNRGFNPINISVKPMFELTGQPIKEEE